MAQIIELGPIFKDCSSSSVTEKESQKSKEIKNSLK